MEITCAYEVNGTLVSNDFIDCHMASANGEYVKVYLYILRHQHEKLEITGIADALNHTESDIRRALSYWERIGVLKASQQQAASYQILENRSVSSKNEASLLCQMPGDDCAADRSKMSISRKVGQLPVGAAKKTFVAQRGSLSYNMGQIHHLNGDEEFTQLLYIAQKYMNKIFTQGDLQVFAYLYDTLHMNAEILEYLVEYCVQSGHTNMRYVEAVAINWHERGLVCVEEARAYAETFTKNVFSVMRTFGLTGRSPGEQEKKAIERWFTVYGFSRELILEACNRTMALTHAPSFQYAEKILSGWKNAGVKSMQDVVALDEKHQAKSRQVARSQKKPVNQFHNFEQRATDYDTMVLEQVKTWTGN